MDVPSTVRTALADRPVAGATCLEAGAGVGNTTTGLLDAGAARVYAVTDDPDHARAVRERVAAPAVERTAVIQAELRDLPLASDAADLVTAHALFNVVAPPALDGIAAELSRVASPGAHLVVDDYAPLPEGAAVRALFAVENAAAELARGEPALTFYPPGVLRRLFAGYGWRLDRERTLLDPVPWTAGHVEAHRDAAQSSAAALPERLGAPLAAEAGRLAAETESEDAGRMYSLAFRYEREASGPTGDRPAGRL